MKSQVWPEQKYHSALIWVFRVGILKWEAGDLAWLHVWYMAVEQVTVFSRLVPIKIRSKEFEWGHFLNRVGFAQIIVLTGAEPDKVGEEKIITTCLNIDIQTVHTQHTSNTIYTYSPAIRKWSRTFGSYSQCKVQHVGVQSSPVWPGVSPVPWKGLIYFYYICCLSCQISLVLVPVWSESQLYLLFTRGRGGL